MPKMQNQVDRPLIFVKSAVLALVVTLFGCASIPEVSTDPTVDREKIREVVRKHLPELESCYLEAIEKRPGAEGKIVLIFVINSDGRTESIRAKEVGPKITDAVDCLIKKVTSWQFDRPVSTDAIEVSYPFSFSENGKF